MRKEQVGRPTLASARLTKALASVLAVKPGDPRLAEAKDEPASPNTRYKYDPEADRS